MYARSWSIPLLLPLLLATSGVHGKHEYDPDFWHFVTRPQLKAPKWDIKIHDSERIRDGYWFVGSKASTEKTIGSGQTWFGPLIYDGNGQPVWVGASQLDSSNIMDFRLSEVNGESMLTMLDRDRAAGVILDNTYEIRHVVPIDYDSEQGVNAHEFNFVGNGTGVMIIRNRPRDVSQEEREAVGYHGSKCKAGYQEFHELDANNNWEPKFDWDSKGLIRLNETTTVYGGTLEKKCSEGWDFIHTNSLDKCPDGDYLLSSRHCNTIYKISGDDGSIVWRLTNGADGSFDMGDVKFSRQHDIRCRGQNGDETIVSMLNNAKGQDPEPAAADNSQGLLISLNTKEMNATLKAVYEHPQGLTEGRYNDRRGNMQVLDNGNAFLGWSERALQSEHAEDGTLLMEARFKADWMGSYRNYKFDFVGRPATLPDVHSAAYLDDEAFNEDPLTVVHVSWNGDTEVSAWKLYEAQTNGTASLIESKERVGFETSFEHHGYLSSVQLKGFDKDGNEIGDSGRIKTLTHPNLPPDRKGSENIDDQNNDHYHDQLPVWTIVLLVLGCISGAALVLLAWFRFLPIPFIARVREMLDRKEVSNYGKLAAAEAGEEQKQSLMADNLRSESLTKLTEEESSLVARSQDWAAKGES